MSASDEPGPLTAEELAAMTLTADLTRAFDRIIGAGPSAAGDRAEVVHHVHALQNMILAQAAARCYPGRFRLLGGGF